MKNDQTDRGQTPFDFLLGFSIFILAVVFIFMMAPGLITPFSEGQSSDPLFADRTADHLSKTELVDSPSTREVDTEAAVDFFEGIDDEDLASYLGADDQTQVHVSIEGPEMDYEVGPDYPSDSDQVTVTQRKMSMNDESHWLYVRVW